MREHTLSRRGPLLIALLTMFSVLAWLQLGGSGDAAPAQSVAPQPGLVMDNGDVFGQQGWFAKYDAVDGEANDEDHNKWINILSIDWAVAGPDGKTGQSRRRGKAVVEDLVISFQYEKASVKLLERSLTGQIIPKLEIELVGPFGTYLRYEMKNVAVSSYQVSGSSDVGPPTVVVGNNFEEIKVTYTEYDEDGGSAGNVETEWKRK